MLNKLGFGRAKSAAAPTQEPQPLARHREMVRIAVKGTLNEHGLGATWVGSAVQLATPPEQGNANADALAIRLIVQEWREDLLRYLPALQKKIIASLGRVEPNINHSRHTVTWEFAPDCGCPIDDLPPATRWSAKVAAGAATPGEVATKRQFDLPPSELDHVADERDDIPSTFAATQPGFLNSVPPDFSKPRR